jgi:long-chain acyl-CoA synthetase
MAAQAMSKVEPVSEGRTSLVRLLSDRSIAEPAAVMLRVKKLGLWEEVSWADEARRVQSLAMGLTSLGLGAGDALGLIADATPESLALDFACQAIGSRVTPIDPYSSMADIRYLLDLAGCHLVAVGDLETLDRLHGSRELDGAQITGAVLLDGTAVRQVRDWKLWTVGEVEHLGQKAAGGKTLVQLAAERAAHEPISFHATAGTQGQPRLTPISSAELVDAWEEFFAAFDPRREDSFVVEAPLSHIAGHAAVLLLPLLFGTIAHFPEHQAAVDEAMADVVPTLSIALPQRWEMRAAAFRARMSEAGPLHRLAYRASLGATERIMGTGGVEPASSRTARLAAGAGRWLVFGPMLRKAGLHRLRFAAVGGRYLSPELVTYWHALGVPLTVFYGATEAGGMIAYQVAPSASRALRPLSTREIRLGKGDEIEVRLPSILDWFATGDRGEITEAGEVLLAYRLSDIVTVDGREVPLGDVERLLVAQGHIKHVAVVGRGRPYLAALVDVDLPSVAAWARANSVRYGSLASLPEEARVIELVAGAVESANADLATKGLPEIKEFAVLRAAETFELMDVLALTGEVRRTEVEKRYRTILDSLYAGSRSHDARAGETLEGGEV